MCTFIPYTSLLVIFKPFVYSTTIQASITLPSEGSTIPSQRTTSRQPKSNVGPIVGGVVGGVTALLLLLGLLRYSIIMRRTKLRLQQEEAAAFSIKPYVGAEPSYSQLDGMARRHRMIRQVNEKGLPVGDIPRTGRGLPSMRMSMTSGEGSNGLVSRSEMNYGQSPVEYEDLRWALELFFRSQRHNAAAPPSYSENSTR